jgi:hypothetical protein
VAAVGSPRGEEGELGVNSIYAWGGREEREGVVWEIQTRDLSVKVAQTRRKLTARDAGETWVIS